MVSNQIDIGRAIFKKMKESGMTNAELARRINTSPQNVGDVLKRETIDTNMLLKVSDALNYDFFKLYIKGVPSIAHEPEPEYRKKKPLAEVSIHIAINDETKRAEILKMLFGDNIPPYLL